MELGMIICVSGVCGFIGGYLISKGWNKNHIPTFMVGCFLFGAGTSSGFWVPCLLKEILGV